jgi:hypothetical protein
MQAGDSAYLMWPPWHDRAPKAVVIRLARRTPTASSSATYGALDRCSQPFEPN